MLTIGIVYLVVTWTVIFLILGVVVLILLRLLANYTDPNPFGWPSRTIRQLTDPIIGPVRRALTGFGVDPKYAPLVTVLLAILLGWFVLQLVAAISNTAAGVLLSLQRHAIVALVGYLLYGLLAFYSLLIFIRILFSWVMVSHTNRIMRFLVNTTEPFLGRRIRISISR